MLQKQAHKRNTCPTAKTESQRLAACCHKLDDIRIKTYRSHRHNDKELAEPFKRCKNLCYYAHACRQRSDKRSQYEVQYKARHNAPDINFMICPLFALAYEIT